MLYCLNKIEREKRMVALVETFLGMVREGTHHMLTCRCSRRRGWSVHFMSGGGGQRWRMGWRRHTTRGVGPTMTCGVEEMVGVGDREQRRWAWTRRSYNRWLTAVVHQISRPGTAEARVEMGAGRHRPRAGEAMGVWQRRSCVG